MVIFFHARSSPTLQRKMFKRIVTLVFTSFMTIIHAQNITFLVNSEITTIDQAMEKLVQIQPHEALPVVLIQIQLEGKLIPSLLVPEDITGTMTKDGKMIQEIEFTFRNSIIQIFFCPKENSDEKCLAPQNFQGMTRVECSKEVIPVMVVEQTSIPCSIQDNSTSYVMGYDICPSEEPYRYKNQELGLYSFCYDKLYLKTLYTAHFITSPKLLESKLLYREQQLIYPYRVNNEFPTANFDDIVDSLRSEILSFYKTKKPMYRVQKLVPGEDMALGTWRKLTYQFINLKLQHKWLFPVWNEISEKVRKEAIRRYKSDDIYFYVRTGVFDITPDIRESDGQIYNIWVKMITSMSRDPSYEWKGVVILMNNFIDYATENSQLILIQNDLLKYCENNLCEPDFQTQVPGRIRCCKVMGQMGQLFGPKMNGVKLPVLPIPGLVKIPT